MCKRFEFLFFGLLLSSLIATNIAYTEERPTIRMMRKDGQLVPAPTPAPRTEPAPSKYFDEEGLERSIKADEETSKRNGWPPSVFMPPDEEDSEDLSKPLTFELPADEQLTGCMYARGYSYPNFCFDDDGKLIFKAGKDPQSVLDSIAGHQGKRGQFNIVPKGYTPGPIDDDAQDVKDGVIAPIDPNDDVSKRMKDFEEGQRRQEQVGK